MDSDRQVATQTNEEDIVRLAEALLMKRKVLSLKKYKTMTVCDGKQRWEIARLDKCKE